MLPQIETHGKWHLRIVPRSSDMKFHKIWSDGCGDMASDGQMHTRMYAQHGDYSIKKGHIVKPLIKQYN